MSRDINVRTDEDLVRDYLNNNNQNAFRIIYEKYFDAVYFTIFGRIGNRTWTEDIVSETFMTLLKVIANYDFKSKLKTFIIGIALNKAKQFIYEKKKLSEISLNEELIFMDEELEIRLPDMKLRNSLNKALEKLPTNYKSVLTARFIESKSISETAMVLKLSEENVRVIQHRAIKKMAEILKK